MMGRTMPTAEYACVFTRPPKERLVAIERLLRAVPGWLDGALAECDLAFATATRYVAAVLRVAGSGLPPAAVARLAFWTARIGGGGFAVSDLSGPAREKFLGELNLCDRTVRGIPVAALPDAASRVFRAVKSPPPQEGPPVLALDVDGRGREGLLYQPERTALFVAGLLAPPPGDLVTLSVRVPRNKVPVDGVARVVDVIGRSAAGAGRPAGFSLRIEGPAGLHEALAAHLPRQAATDHRTSPRLAVKAPVTVKPAADPAPAPVAPASAPAAPRPGPGPHARLEYATDQELAADWIENLSHGGAFVRSAQPRPVGTALVLDLALPDGVQLTAQAVVTAATPRGMGVRFVLTPEQDDALAAVIARITARPRRALVVDDDAMVRQMLADALSARGFEVLTAASATEGVERLSEELLALDLLVTDVCMPGMDGEELVRFIRRAGGEADLAIVAVTGRMEIGVDRQLEAAGADAVLDKAIGPEMVAAAADAALERKRAARG
jgi:CheY-like chemotaxis protein